MDINSTIAQDRKTFLYRFLESLLGISTLSFIFGFVVLVIFSPNVAAVFLLVYAMLWIFKILLNTQYTILSYKNFLRWEKVDWEKFLDGFDDPEIAKNNFKLLENKYKNKINWTNSLISSKNEYLNLLESGSKYANPKNVFNVAIFATYNESSDVLKRSLACLRDCGWDMKNLVITVSQEARAGDDFNAKLRSEIFDLDWIAGFYLDEPENVENIKIDPQKLNVWFTQHPDGLIGEIKGKASNEDWGARRCLDILENRLGVDLDLTLVTSLDADSHICKWFFHNLSYKFCFVPDRHQAGFQPMHVYSNNLFQTGMIPRMVASQTTIYNMTNLSIADQAFFFAIYSVPARVLQKVDFWVKEIIAEDSLLFTKCLTTFNGNFRIYAHYGIFEGDAVEADDYLEEILNQYKQLQRWSWGGVEGFPYLFKRLWLTKESKNIKLITKIKWTYLKFGNHFFWVTTPFIFSIGPLLPEIIHNRLFTNTVIAQNLNLMTSYFSWISLISVGVFAFLTTTFQAKRAVGGEKLGIGNYTTLAIQFICGPILFGVMAFPALDAQIRGVMGKYLGYWVTPKK